MTSVYVDVGAAAVGSVTPEGRVPSSDPEAIRALRHLAEAGVQVFVVTAGGAQPDAELCDIARAIVPTVPPQPEPPAFYLTSDIERCQGSSARLKTVLIGGAQPNGSVRRCDAVARDVQTAALEILAADAMPPAGALNNPA